MADQDKLILSRETAAHLLEGISFFKENPAAKEWQNLDKDLFIFLCRELCQLPVEEEENLNDYLARLEDFLKKIVNEELTAPSLPQNLEELVEAWEKFLAQEDAQAPPPPKVNLPTVEDWIKTLQEKRVQEKVAPKTEKALETSKERVVREIITPPVFKNFQEQIKKTLKVSLGKVEPEIIKEINPVVTEALAVNLPFLTPQELTSLNLSEKGEIVENTIEAALPDIGEFLVAKGVSLSPQETANFLDQLTIAINDNLEKLTVFSPENRLPQEKIAKTEGSATPTLAALLHPRQTATLLFNPQLRRNLEALDKNPSLPFSLIVEGEEASPGEKIKNIFLQKGINFQSVNLIKPLKEETESLILAAKGIKSSDISAAIRAAREENQPAEEIKKLEEIFSRQLEFEKKFPLLAKKFFRFRKAKEIVSGQKNDQKLPPWPFAQIKSQTNLETIRWNFLRTANRFLEKIGLVKERESPSGKTTQSSQIWYYPQKFFQTVASFWQKTGVGKTVKSWFSQQTHHFWQQVLEQIRGFSKAEIKKAAQEGAKKGVTKAIAWLSTKLAATKLGAALGSIAPGIGNVVGMLVGFVVDIGISLFKKGGEFLEKLTGGQTEAEQKLKAALGPFSFLVSPLVLIFIIALGAPLILVFLTITNIGGAFLSPAGGGEPTPSLYDYLNINKTASPSASVTTGTKITYTIIVNAPEGELTNVIVKDSFDKSYIEIDHSSISPTPTETTENELSWSGFDFSDAGSTLTITYQAVAKTGVTEDTKIRNTAVVSAIHEGKTITLSDSVTLNSSCQDIVNTAQNIISTLEIKNGSCKYNNLYNHSTDQNWCNINGNCCIYCNTLVTLAYTENGRQDPIPNFRAMKDPWRAKGMLIENKPGVNLGEISEGDVILFDVEGKFLSHTGLVCGVQSDGIFTCEANTNVNTKIFYPLHNGVLDTVSGVTINSIGKTCEN